MRKSLVNKLKSQQDLEDKSELLERQVLQLEAEYLELETIKDGREQEVKDVEKTLNAYRKEEEYLKEKLQRLTDACNEADSPSPSKIHKKFKPMMKSQTLPQPSPVFKDVESPIKKRFVKPKKKVSKLVPKRRKTLSEKCNSEVNELSSFDSSDEKDNDGIQQELLEENRRLKQQLQMVGDTTSNTSVTQRIILAIFGTLLVLSVFMYLQVL